MTLELATGNSKQSHSKNQQESEEETEYETKTIARKTGKFKVNFHTHLLFRKINTKLLT